MRKLPSSHCIQNYPGKTKFPLLDKPLFAFDEVDRRGDLTVRRSQVGRSNTLPDIISIIPRNLATNALQVNLPSKTKKVSYYLFTTLVITYIMVF